MSRDPYEWIDPWAMVDTVNEVQNSALARLEKLQETRQLMGDGEGVSIRSVRRLDADTTMTTLALRLITLIQGAARTSKGNQP